MPAPYPAQGLYCCRLERSDAEEIDYPRICTSYGIGLPVWSGFQRSSRRLQAAGDEQDPTMVKELNEAAVAGYRFEQAMGGDTAHGGSEVVAIVSRDKREAPRTRYEYKLLATNKTST